MSAKHTPGSWHVAMPVTEGPPADFDGLTVQSHFGLVVRLPEGDETEVDPENLANARLIAAAPELLEALKDCAEYGALTWGHDPENEPDCYRLARAAIAKATQP